MSNIKSMTFGSARIAETGHAGWEGTAKAGDQKQTSSTNDTKGEVSMQAGYVSSKGWWIFRFINVAFAIAFAEQLIKACNNVHIGYDQSQRDTLWNYVNKYGIKDMSDVKQDVETDCSALMRVIIYVVTGKDVGNIRTVSMKAAMEKSGLFMPTMKYTDSTTIYDGDIVCTCESGHTGGFVKGNPRPNTSATPAASATTAPQAPFSKYKIAVANCSVLNLRKGPGTSYKILGTLKAGHQMTIREEKDGWGRVICYPDSIQPQTSVEGWISLKYTKRV